MRAWRWAGSLPSPSGFLKEKVTTRPQPTPVKLERFDSVGRTARRDEYGRETKRGHRRHPQCRALPL